jgi:hypothetical protein
VNGTRPPTARARSNARSHDSGLAHAVLRRVERDDQAPRSLVRDLDRLAEELRLLRLLREDVPEPLRVDPHERPVQLHRQAAGRRPHARVLPPGLVREDLGRRVAEVAEDRSRALQLIGRDEHVDVDRRPGRPGRLEPGLLQWALEQDVPDARSTKGAHGIRGRALGQEGERLDAAILGHAPTDRAEPSLLCRRSTVARA